MPSFGEKLKLEREKRKITLDQISSTTKIGTRMLQALEEEKFNQLPGGIFNKGFVRAYARAVGIDEDQAVADYLEASGDAPPVRVQPSAHEPSHRDAPDHDSPDHDSPGHDSRQHDPRDRAPRTYHLPHAAEENGRLEIRAEVASRQLPWGWFAVILLVVALALTFWSRHRREREKLSSHPPTASEISTTQSPTDAAAPSPATPSSAAPSSVALSPAAASQLQPSPVSAKTGSANSTSLSAQKPTSTAPQVRPNSAPAPGEFVVSVLAREESWLSVSIDGKPVGSVLLEAGDERSYRSHKDVTLKAGNAGALDFSLNGKTLPIGGDYGEVRTITIGPAGLVPTAPPPATP